MKSRMGEAAWRKRFRVAGRKTQWMWWAGTMQFVSRLGVDDLRGCGAAVQQSSQDEPLWGSMTSLLGYAG